MTLAGVLMLYFTACLYLLNYLHRREIRKKDQELRIQKITHVMDKIAILRQLEKRIPKHAYIHLGHQLDWLTELHMLLYDDKSRVDFYPFNLKD